MYTKILREISSEKARNIAKMIERYRAVVMTKKKTTNARTNENQVSDIDIKDQPEKRDARIKRQIIFHIITN